MQIEQERCVQRSRKDWMALGLVLVGAVACGSGEQTPTDAGLQPTAAEREAFNQLIAFVKDDLAQNKVPGASIAVVLHDELLLASAVGVRWEGGTVPVTTSTRFAVGSMSKMVVAAAAMSVVDEGKLDLHAPIPRYLPWFKLADGFDAGAVTLHHLLTHSAGFPEVIFGCGGPQGGDKKDWFAANPQPLWMPPGTAWDYSSLGFTLASLVATAAAGVDESTFEQFAHDRVFAPAGMDTAIYDAQVAEAGDYAVGHIIDDQGRATQMQMDPYDCPIFNPPAGVKATASDYARFAMMVLAGGGTTLKPASLTAMMAPHVSTGYRHSEFYGYGLGWEGEPLGAGDPVIQHGGVMDGYQSQLLVVPAEHFAVVVLENATARTASGVFQPDSSRAALKALELFVRPGSWSTPDPPNPALWAKFVGTYKDPYGSLGTWDVTLVNNPDGGVPTLNWGGLPMTQLMTSEAWVLPNGVSGVFHVNDAGVYDRLVTGAGVANRQ